MCKNICNDFDDQIQLKLNKMHVRPYVRCIIQKAVSVRALYDTGADITCMSKKTFRGIPIEKRPVKMNVPNNTVGIASASSMTSLGTYKMTLECKVNRSSSRFGFLTD